MNFKLFLLLLISAYSAYLPAVKLNQPVKIQTPSGCPTFGSDEFKISYKAGSLLDLLRNIARLYQINKDATGINRPAYTVIAQAGAEAIEELIITLATKIQQEQKSDDIDYAVTIAEVKKSRGKIEDFLLYLYSTYSVTGANSIALLLVTLNYNKFFAFCFNSPAFKNILAHEQAELTQLTQLGVQLLLGDNRRSSLQEPAQFPVLQPLPVAHSNSNSARTASNAVMPAQSTTTQQFPAHYRVLQPVPVATHNSNGTGTDSNCTTTVRLTQSIVPDVKKLPTGAYNQHLEINIQSTVVPRTLAAAPIAFIQPVGNSQSNSNSNRPVEVTRENKLTIEQALMLIERALKISSTPNGVQTASNMLIAALKKPLTNNRGPHFESALSGCGLQELACLLLYVADFPAQDYNDLFDFIARSSKKHFQVVVRFMHNCTEKKNQLLKKVLALSKISQNEDLLFELLEKATNPELLDEIHESIMLLFEKALPESKTCEPMVRVPHLDGLISVIGDSSDSPDYSLESVISVQSRATQSKRRTLRSSGTRKDDQKKEKRMKPLTGQDMLDFNKQMHGQPDFDA